MTTGTDALTEGERYDELVADWRETFDALFVRSPYESGLLQTERLNEFEVLVRAEQRARQLKDDFMKSLQDDRAAA